MAAKAPPAKAKAKKGFDPNAVGVFSYLGSHHVNTDYGLGPNAIDLPGRWNGIQMTHGIPDPHPLHGTAIDIEVKRLGENDPYVDPGKHDRAAAHASVAKRVSEKGFFPPKGSYGELLGPRYENINEGDEKDELGATGAERKAKLKKLPKRGMYTAPGKKGCSNTPGVTIGKKFDSFPETYQPARELSKKANEKARARIEIPWGAGAAGNAIGRDFDAMMQNVTYESGAWAEKQRNKKTGNAIDAPKPFKPGGSKMADVKNYPYQPDPHDYEKERRLKAWADQKKAGTFKPPAGAKSTMQSSISKYDKGTWSAPSSLRETQLIK